MIPSFLVHQKALIIVSHTSSSSWFINIASCAPPSSPPLCRNGRPRVIPTQARGRGRVHQRRWGYSLIYGHLFFDKACDFHDFSDLDADYRGLVCLMGASRSPCLITESQAANSAAGAYGGGLRWTHAPSWRARMQVGNVPRLIAPSPSLHATRLRHPGKNAAVSRQ